ncbi:MAG: prepilin-type N-terminal cleavage/methylation domain-containing protein [bacterium]|nr:prepilin-type N-terminal cleavage/methylation domain-containing protein [bacterium]
MNKKGFTLVEILAVLVIIVVVSLIGTVSITGVKKKMEENLFKNKLGEIISAASKWGEDNKSELDTNKTVGFLITNGYLETEEAINPIKYEHTCGSLSNDVNGYVEDGLCKNVITNNVDYKVLNSLVVKIYRENNRVYSCIVDSESNRNLLVDWDKYSDLNYYCR